MESRVWSGYSFQLNARDLNLCQSQSKLWDAVIEGERSTVVRIRLRRMGAKKKPFYRIVVADKRSPRDGRFIETIGTYDPLTEPETVNLELDRAAYWLSVGAQPSDGVVQILKNQGLIDDAGRPIPLRTEAVADEISETTVVESEAEEVVEPVEA